MVVLVTLIHSKMKALEWSKHFFYYKSMGIFLDPQGQLTLPPVVRTGHILKFYENLCYLLE